jgi:hypothetical protein
VAGDAHRVVNRGREVLWPLSVKGRVGTVLVGRSNNEAPLDASGSDKDRLNGSPVIATGFSTGAAVAGVHLRSIQLTDGTGNPSTRKF